MTTPTAAAGPAAAARPALCPDHARIWRAWRDNHYDPAHPREPGGGTLLDARTPHADRERRWVALNRAQMAGVEAACQSGRTCTICDRCQEPARGPHGIGHCRPAKSTRAPEIWSSRRSRP